MTKDDWFELIMYKLIDYDLTNVKYIGIDYDGEIVTSSYLMTIEDNTIPPNGQKVWGGKPPPDHMIPFCTDVYLNPVMDNYAEMLFKL